MRIEAGSRMNATAAALLAAVLVFPFSSTAFAWQGDLQAEPLLGLRQGGEAGGPKAAGVEIPADNAALCGKCHSSCEAGKVHEGVAPTAPAAGVGLPLTADGRTACFTCHAPHTGGKSGEGTRLRVSNLRRELCLSCHRQESDQEPRFEIVSPPDRSVVQEQRVALIGKISGVPGSFFAVTVNGAKFHIQTKGSEFFTLLTLQDGVNRIEITHEDRVIWRGELYRGESASSGYGRTTSAHRTESREQCGECHADKGGGPTRASSDASALCYGCHDRFEGKRYLHGPLAVGACLACHDPHRGYGTAHLREERGLLCANCHAARETSPTTACNASNKACADCHDPHQSDSRFLLRGPQYTMRTPEPLR
jgi:predicted CXXCH cytochrome family protein